MKTIRTQVTGAELQTKKYLTLLELSKAIAAHRDLSQLFHDLACRLQFLYQSLELNAQVNGHDGLAPAARNIGEPITSRWLVRMTAHVS